MAEILYLGLDISSSIIGISILNKDKKIIFLSHIDLRKIKNFWNKIDFAKQELLKIFDKYQNISYIIIEEPLKKKKRKSNLNTIVLLQKFNAILSFVCRDKTNIDPIFVSALEVRKHAGVLIIPPKLCGKNHKQQTFDFVINSGLIKADSLSKTRNGTYQKYCYDQVDAFICAFGYLRQFCA